jgi:hypothetical protein
VLQPPLGHSSELTAAISAPVNCKFLGADNWRSDPKGLLPTSCGGDETFSEAKSSRRSFHGDSKLLQLAVFDILPSEQPPTACQIVEAIVCAHVDEFQQGASTLEKILAYARSGEIFNTKYQIVEATPRVDHERQLAVCLVLSITVRLPIAEPSQLLRGRKHICGV